MGKYPITEHYVTTLEGFGYIQPEETISIHRIFDILTSLSVHKQSVRDASNSRGDTSLVQKLFSKLTGFINNVSPSRNPTDDMYDCKLDQWEAITHAFLAMGISDTERIKRVQSKQTNHEKLKTLFDSEDVNTYALLHTLWGIRCAHMALPLSWDGLIEGHPIIGLIEYKEEWMNLSNIADEALRTARANKINAHKIDLFILKLWGQTTPLKEITVNDLAKITKSVINLNELYSAEEFDLS